MSVTSGLNIDRFPMVLLCGLMAAAAAGCGGGTATEDETVEEAAESFVKVVNVEIRRVESTDFTSYVRLTGAVEALEDVVISSQESGVIRQIIADKGTRVRAGQPIARIDDEILAAQVDEARASSSLARERFERQRQLWEDEGIGSEIAFLQTKYDAQSADARLAFLEARLARHIIKSPIAGVLDDRYVDAGEIVAPGTPVARVLTTDRLKVVGGVPERFGPYVRQGGRAVLNFDVLPGPALEGEIAYVGAAVDPRNRTFPVEILLDNPEGRLKPQMVANVRVATERLTDVIVVPQDVVIRTEDGYQVFVVAGQGAELRAEARPVDLGPSFENEVVVSAGLSNGERLIVTGHQLVDAGDRVREVSEGGAR
jgi:membrane fusion protein (multidrug efflux system)